jgi:hypothetical protein
MKDKLTTNADAGNVAPPDAKHLLPAVIVNTKGWDNHWFENMEGTEIIVKKYPYKSTKGGYTTYCNCTECLSDRRGRELHETYEVVSGYENIGSIIPECCLSFNGR